MRLIQAAAGGFADCPAGGAATDDLGVEHAAAQLGSPAVRTYRIGGIPTWRVKAVLKVLAEP